MSSTEAGPARVRRLDPVTRALVQLASLLVVIGALKLTAPVSLPLAFSLFVIAIFWPLYAALEQKIPKGLAAVAVLLAFLAALALLGGSLWYTADQVMSGASDYQVAWREQVSQARSWLTARGLPMPEAAPSLGAVASELQRLASGLFGAVGGFVLVIAFVVLGLLEVHDFRRKITGEPARHFTQVVRRVAVDFQRYFLVRTLIGLITGALVSLGAWALGLQFPLLWGLLNFLLNYIPTLGSIIGVFPPVLFSLLQYGGWAMPLATFGVVGGVQLVMGNYVDPLLQGRYLRLSALVVLLSVAFWGWVWGVPGAFIGVPMTIVIVLGTSQFERTRWIAVLLAELDEAPEPFSPEPHQGHGGGEGYQLPEPEGAG